MKTFNSLDEIMNIEPTVVALGNFDGVHLGHQALIKAAKEIALKNNLKVAVFSFSNHPKNLISNKKVLNIAYQDEKALLMEKEGVDYLFNIKFDEKIMKTSAEDFICDILLKKFNMKQAVCGFNYHFGYKGEGDTALLKQLGEYYGYGVTCHEPVTIDGDVVSSTLIRGLIKAGEMEDVKKFLGRNYDIEGEVVVGNRLGRTIGFPTSNITIDENMVTPPNGVYITYCIYNGAKYPSITNVGVKPTIGKYEKNMETHIFNFSKELYGKTIRVEFVKMTREEVKFKDVETLSKQIEKDCLDAKKYHGIV
ncbi:MAG: bifunctional riboflavin kinase/FAD synthetase [Clostridia bacterium]|nr:bifunctional riboflavin kinase/FAD synthetase [Clostridia bacterium]